jgi:hypothetical protein
MNPFLHSYRRVLLLLTLFGAAAIAAATAGCQTAREAAPRTTAEMKGTGPPIPGSQRYAPRQAPAQAPGPANR